jgi:SAM-dependent methyltransferase
MKNENLDEYDSAYQSDFKYNDENTWLLSRYAKLLVESAISNEDSKFLSLGIGHQIVCDGIMSLVKSEDNNYTILEGSKSIIENFKREHKASAQVHLVHTYFENFETEENFDLIEMGFVLEHVDDPSEIVAKFKNFLSDKGRMFIAVPNAESLHRLIGKEAGFLDNIHQLSPYDKQLGHKRYFDLEVLSDLVHSHGLEITSVRGLLLKPITTAQMQVLAWDSKVIEALLNLGERFPRMSNGILIEARLK